MAIEGLQEFSKGDRGTVERWLRELEIAGRFFADWERSAIETIKRFEDERPTGTQGFAILQANTETLKGALFQRLPRPQIAPRYRKSDPEARQVATLLSESLEYMNDSPNAEREADDGITHALVVGRCVHRVRYEPTVIERRDPVLEQLAGEQRLYFDAALNEIPAEDVQRDDYGPFVAREELALERADLELVHWQDFRHAPARRWADVRWIAFRHLMTREELKRGFGAAVAARVTLGVDVEMGTGGAALDCEVPDLFKRAEVWEVWDKQDRRVLFISPGLEEQPLGEYGDVYALRHFWPCPEPLRMVRRLGSLLPVPEFRFYQDQAAELDEITGRIRALIKALRVAGVYDNSFPTLAALVQGGDNKLYPVDNFDQLNQRGGVAAAIQWMPIADIARAIIVLREQRNDILQVIREITGISDIQRASTDPRETFGAQRLKAEYASMRLSSRKREVARYFRDLLEIQIEIMAERFAPGTLAQITGRELTAGMVRLMQSDTSRNFRINVETDATLEVERQEDKADLVELFRGVEAIGRGVAALGAPAETGRELLLYGLRRWRADADVIDALERMPIPQQGPSAQDQAALQDAETRRLEAETRRGEVMMRMRAEAQKLQLKAQELGIKEKELRGRTLLEVGRIIAQAEQARDRRLLESQRNIE